MDRVCENFMESMPRRELRRIRASLDELKSTGAFEHFHGVRELSAVMIQDELFKGKKVIVQGSNLCHGLAGRGYMVVGLLADEHPALLMYSEGSTDSQFPYVLTGATIDHWTNGVTSQEFNEMKKSGSVSSISVLATDAKTFIENTGVAGLKAMPDIDVKSLLQGKEYLSPALKRRRKTE